MQFFFARVITWSKPGFYTEYLFRSMSMGFVKKRSITKRALPICCATRKPSRSICTTWEIDAPPRQLLMAPSPSLIWRNNMSQLNTYLKTPFVVWTVTRYQGRQRKYTDPNLWRIEYWVKEKYHSKDCKHIKQKSINISVFYFFNLMKPCV